MSRKTFDCPTCHKQYPDQCLCGDVRQQHWLENRTAMHQLCGFSEREAKEKAMSDWHTYEVAKDQA